MQLGLAHEKCHPVDFLWPTYRLLLGLTCLHFQQESKLESQTQQLETGLVALPKKYLRVYKSTLKTHTEHSAFVIFTSF